MFSKCTDKQAWRIYYEIYGDTPNKLTGLCEPTESQKIIRKNLGWPEDEKTVNIIKEILTSEQASIIINYLVKNNFRAAEKLLKKYATTTNS